MAQLKIALVLEDEPILGFALEDMLLELGFAEVEVANTIDHAQIWLQGRLPDVAILDVNIHGERSYAVSDTLLTLKVPFVFATGYGDAEHPPALKSVTTLTKPYRRQELQAALEAAMGGAL